MSRKIKKVITIAVSVLVIIIVLISIIFIIKPFKDKEKIENIIETYSDENIQNRLDDDDITSTDDFTKQVDGENVIGVIKIDNINYKGLVYKGTSLDTLSKGVGHFESSPYLNGNVCLAAHNTNKFWAKLHTLEIGDKIIYTSFLGTKEYEVTDMTEISETDWSKLSNTNENMLTLITCVKGKSALRLCVQALEVN